jgi:hypothetical protein
LKQLFDFVVDENWAKKTWKDLFGLLAVDSDFAKEDYILHLGLELFLLLSEHDFNSVALV